MHTHHLRLSIAVAVLCALVGSLALPGIAARAAQPEPPAFCTAPITPVVLASPTIVTDCTQAGVQSALSKGSQIAFDCGAQPFTIKLTAPLITSATADTVIDGGGLITLDGDNKTRILEKPFTPGAEKDKTRGNDLTIQNLRFVNAKAPAATKAQDGNARGGAVWATSPGTKLHIINSVFENNRTTSTTDEDNQGGAVYAANIYETVIVGSTFSGNEAGNGGAFGGIATGLVVYNSSFTNNKASDATSGGIVRGHGGAIHLDGVTNDFNPDSNNVVDVCGSTFIGNTAVRGGGAIKTTISDNLGTKATYQRSSFVNNRLVGVPPAEGSGGAIYHIEDDRANGRDEDNIEISGSTFAGNSAYQQGGAIWLTVLGKGRVVNSTFTENKASEAGANRVGQGGALLIGGGMIDIVNTTFARNFATFQGGAIFAGGDGDPDRVVTLANSLFDRNTLDPTQTNPVTSEFQGYHTNRPLKNGGNNLQFPRKKAPDFDNDVNNLITMPASAILFADPLLDTLADNGGATATLALKAGSPAINAGGAACPATDQRGAARVGVCDIGAFEFGGSAPVLGGPKLTSISPTFVEAAAARDLTLTLRGNGFTKDSVARWNGKDRPTTFVSATELTATISKADVAALGSFAVTVYDPAAPDGAQETAAQTFRVVNNVSSVWLPLTRR